MGCEMHDVYNGDIDSLDLIPGMFAEDRPTDSPSATRHSASSS